MCFFLLCNFLCICLCIFRSASWPSSIFFPQTRYCACLCICPFFCHCTWHCILSLYLSLVFLVIILILSSNNSLCLSLYRPNFCLCIFLSSSWVLTIIPFLKCVIVPVFACCLAHHHPHSLLKCVFVQRYLNLFVFSSGDNLWIVLNHATWLNREDVYQVLEAFKWSNKRVNIQMQIWDGHILVCKNL